MKDKITANRGDQLGMQVYSRIYCQLYAEYKNFEYVHTPFLREDIVSFESFFNLGKGFSTIYEKQYAEDLGKRITPLKIGRNHNDLPALNFSEKFVDILLQKYYLTPKHNSEKFSKSEGLKIAIHARSCKAGGALEKTRNTPESFVPAIFRKLSAILPDKQLSIHIYSNENININFKDDIFQKDNMEIYTHYDTSMAETIHDFICSDILFRYGASTFSGICSIYNQNLSVFSFPPGMNWLINSFNSKNCFFLNRAIPFPCLEEISREHII